jgi:NAD(P)-dependent dehydrogenase (short-subunit alcohol dehydrogenase family)
VLAELFALAAMSKLAVIVGCGSKHDKDGADTELPPTSRWGLGGALSLRFASAGFHVILMGRRKEIAEAVSSEVATQGGKATPVSCDVADDLSVKAAFASAKELGDIEVVVFNVAPGFPPGRGFSNLPVPAEIDPDYLTAAFNIGVTGCVRCIREVVPDMVARGRGTILLSGATMALRGGSQFGCMAPVKAALRSLGQSMYNEYAAKGVHVAHVVIDGVIESPNTKPWGEKVMLQDPADLADAYIALHEQKPTVWSYEIMLSPKQGSVGMRM